MTPQEIEDLADAAAAALQLTIAVEHRSGVLHYLALAASYAELVNSLPMTIADEPAPVFLPVSAPARVEDNQ